MVVGDALSLLKGERTWTWEVSPLRALWWPFCEGLRLVVLLCFTIVR
jgi:hypothetical protein